MQIYLRNSQKDLAISASSLRLLIAKVLEKNRIECDEISIHFVTSRKISKLHADFFDDPTTTDCITFPIGSEDGTRYKVLGEVFICPKTAIEYGKKNKKDPYEETSLYVVHGILHLLGYDDIDPKDRKQMRKKEKECMTYLKNEGALLSKKRLSKTPDEAFNDLLPP